MRALIDLVVPCHCAGCRRGGPVLCPDCAALLGDPRRVRLGRTAPPAYALGRYHGALRTAVLAYKERGRRELARPFGTALASAVRALPPAMSARGPLWLVPVPSRPSAARRRGGDHVRRMAERATAALTASGVASTVVPALRLARGARDSVGLDATARAANLAGRVLVRPGALPPPGSGVVLLDDVLTTGATAAACAAALVAVQVRVEAVVVLASGGAAAPSG